MSDAEYWNGIVGTNWAEHYRRTDRSFGGLTERLLARMRDFRFARVLDIGCGAGELSLAIARGRPGISVLGVDVSAPLVEAAHTRGARLTNVAFELGDASQWSSADGFRPDLMVSRHGVMFFEDPAAAFTHLAGIAAPGANLLFSCFRGPSANELFTGVGGLLPAPDSPPDPAAPGPMAFADPDHVRSILEPAGWGVIEFESFDFAMVVGAGDDPVADAVDYFLTIGPAAAHARELNAADRAAFVERLTSYVETKRFEGIVALRAGAWIVNAKLS